MSMNVSDFVWHRFQEWGIKRVYGYPGDGVGGPGRALAPAHPEGLRRKIETRSGTSPRANFTGKRGQVSGTNCQP